jgi:hypothetical protein
MVCSTTRVQPRWITTNPTPLPGRGNDREKENIMNFKFHTNNGDNRFAGATFPAFPVKWDWSTNGWIKTTKNDPDAVWGVDSPTGIGPIGQPVSGFGVFVYGDGTPADVPIDENLPGYAAVLGRKGGSVKSERKAASSRENGKLGGRPRKEYLVIRAVKGTGGYELVADNGDRPQEGLAHKSAKLAYDDAALLWPTNSVWEGKRIPGGYRITI